MEWPSMLIVPSEESYNLNNNAAIVDFPLPEAPTIPTVEPVWIWKLTESSTFSRGRAGYEKLTSLKTISLPRSKFSREARWPDLE